MTVWKTGEWAVRPLSDGMLAVTGYYGRDAYVRIPDRFFDENAHLLSSDWQEEEDGCISGIVTAVDEGAFARKGFIRSVTVPEGVLEIGARAFSGCRGLRDVDLPQSLLVVGEEAFAGCVSLTRLFLPENVSVLADGVCRGCEKLHMIDMTWIHTIGAHAFEGCTALPRGSIRLCSTSGSGAFHGCTQLFDDEGFAVIGGILADCRSRQRVLEVPDGIVIADEGCFSGLTETEEIILPDSLREIRSGAFGCLSKLRRISLPGSVKVIGNNQNPGAPSGFRTEFTLGTLDWEPFASADENAFEVSAMQDILPRNSWDMAFARQADGLIVLRYFGKEDQPVIPESYKGIPVTAIGPYAFGWKDITHVVLPKQLSEIGLGAFTGCSRLTGVSFNDALREVSDCAFAGCERLQGAVFGNSLTRIGIAAFDGCTAMRAAVLPDSLQKIGAEAFEKHVVLCGTAQSCAALYARENGTPFYDSLSNTRGFVEKVVHDRYASYHAFVSADSAAAMKWSFRGDVEGV